MPVALVASRAVPVRWASVPKAPINEYRKSGLSKHKIWIARQLLMSAPPTDAVPSEDSGEAQLRIPVSAGTDGRHNLRSLLLRENIHHNEVWPLTFVL
jgi:hypothetical protein